MFLKIGLYVALFLWRFAWLSIFDNKITRLVVYLDILIGRAERINSKKIKLKEILSGMRVDNLDLTIEDAWY